MKHCILLILCLASVTANAQTRRIAHRSHGGSNSERYDNVDGNYGDIRPRLIKVHLESGRDTFVNYWDSLARPYYLDTIPRGMNHGTLLIQNIHQVGHVAGRMVM